MHDGCTHGHAEPAPAPAPATQAGGPARRSAYWRSVEQLAATPEFQSFMHREFQPGAAEVSDDDRRSFIKVMGASFARSKRGRTARGAPKASFVPASALSSFTEHHDAHVAFGKAASSRARTSAMVGDADGSANTTRPAPSGSVPAARLEPCIERGRGGGLAAL
ncbi:MAG: TAT-variant-translocated molybdopterin oxidoreductase, partial [Phycisphaerales bacterium]